MRPLAIMTLITAATLATGAQSATITSGTVNVRSGPGDFHLLSDDFELSGSLYSAYIEGHWDWPGVTFAPGESISTSGYLVGSSFGNGSYFVEGGDATPVAWAPLTAGDGPSYFIFTSSPVEIAEGGKYSAPFSFNGALCGVHKPITVNASCDAKYPELTGSGTVTFEAEPWADTASLYIVRAVQYQFSVPEPQNTWLFGLGLMALAASRRLTRGDCRAE